MEKGLWPVLILILVVVIVAWWSLSGAPTVQPTPSPTISFSATPVATPTPTPELPGISVVAPVVDALINVAPIKVSGTTSGTGGWIGFEGQVGTVQLFDANDEAVSDPHILTATTDWTTPPVSFALTFGTKAMLSKIKTSTGYLLFKNENPSGDPAKDQTFKVPVKFK